MSRFQIVTFAAFALSPSPALELAQVGTKSKLTFIHVARYVTGVLESSRPLSAAQSPRHISFQAKSRWDL